MIDNHRRLISVEFVVRSSRQPSLKNLEYLVFNTNHDDAEHRAKEQFYDDIEMKAKTLGLSFLEVRGKYLLLPVIKEREVLE